MSECVNYTEQDRLTSVEVNNNAEVERDVRQVHKGLWRIGG